MKLPSRKTNIVLCVIWFFLGVAGIIFLTLLSKNDLLSDIGKYLLLSFLPSTAFLLIICLQCKIRNRFLEAMLYAGLISIGYIISTGTVWSILAIGDDLFDTFVLFFFSIFPFTIFCPNDSLFGWVILFAVWILFIFLLGLSLWRAKRIINRKIRLSAFILVIFAFGAVFNICYFLSLREIVAAISAAYRLP